jgi:hypothetical protein
MTTPELGDDEPVLVRPNKDDYDNLDEYAADDEKALDEYMEKMDAWEARREARRAVASAPAPPSPPLDKVVASGKCHNIMTMSTYKKIMEMTTKPRMRTWTNRSRRRQTEEVVIPGRRLPSRSAISLVSPSFR